jgi:pantoate--beta-alanine ligase
MGCLHQGHLSLVTHAQGVADRVILTIFVNPLQFGESRDLADYPRQFDEDCRLAEEAGVDCVFAPEEGDIYPPGFQTRVTLSKVTQGYEGEGRPGHFDGVATIVCKLFNATRPDVAVFGEKDFQQLCMIRQMVSDLDYPIEILAGDLVREPDGLAMSSRNTLLNKAERTVALCLSRALFAVQQEVCSAPADALPAIEELVTTASKSISKAGGEIEYFSIVDERTLAKEKVLTRWSRVVVAAKIGGRVRLLDTISLARD